MAELGFLGIAVPEQWGGAGLDTVSYALAMEEISRACASTGVIMSVNNSLVCDPIYRVRHRRAEAASGWRRSRAGKLLGCFALSEPEAGSDAAAQKTDRREATATAGCINGTKNWITNGPVADVCVLFAMNDAAAGHKGITAFILPMKTQGRAHAGRPTTSSASAARKSCADLPRRRARCPSDAVLGEVGDGFKVAMSTLDGGRIGIAAQALGIARAALEDALAYAQRAQDLRQADRAAPGDPVQAGRHGDRDRRRAPADAGAPRGSRTAGSRYGKEAAMAKLFASEVANRAAREAIQIFGGYGYVDRVPGRAALPRREDHRDLRGHERDPAPGDRRAISRKVDDDEERDPASLAVAASRVVVKSATRRRPRAVARRSASRHTGDPTRSLGQHGPAGEDGRDPDRRSTRKADDHLALPVDGGRGRRGARRTPTAR